MRCRDFRPGILFTLIEYIAYERYSPGEQAELRRLYRHQANCRDCGEKYRELVPEFTRYSTAIGMEIVAENAQVLDGLMQPETNILVRLRRELGDMVQQNR